MNDIAVERSFLRRYLDPSERLGELLFGLIMVLSFTLTAGVALRNDPGEARELLWATLGCNLAWGVIDGAFFIMGALLDRARTSRAIRLVQAAPDENAALAVIERATEGTVATLATDEGKRRLFHDIYVVVRELTPQEVTIRREDVFGAAASCFLVVLVALPPVVPFLLIDEPWRALRVSNLLLLGLLFGVGYQWGSHACVNRWKSGFFFLLFGLFLVGMAIALGG